tara:strand:- start:525 stop:905 length:381 start_codon:yes stop_codon:yes gene_type:complete
MKISANYPIQKLENRTDHQDKKLFEEAKRAKDISSLKKVAHDFESLFVEIMLKSMRKTVAKSGFLDGGNAEDVYKSMLDTEYSKDIASNSGTNGLAYQIEKQLLIVLDKNQKKVALDSYSREEGKD